MHECGGLVHADLPVSGEGLVTFHRRGHDTASEHFRYRDSGYWERCGAESGAGQASPDSAPIDSAPTDATVDHLCRTYWPEETR